MKRNFRRGLVICTLLGLLACSDDSTGPVDPVDLEFAASLGVNLGQMTKTASGLYYQDLVVGTGTEAMSGDSITVDYEGWLHNGVKFDSSLDRGEPATFGLNQVIQGWQEGVPGMKVGGTRKLVIPPDLAYGKAGAGNGIIPSYATLVFDIQLLDVKD